MSIGYPGMYPYSQYPQYGMNPYMRQEVPTLQGPTKNAFCGAADDGKIDSSTATREYFGGMVDCVKSIATPMGLATTAAIGAVCLAFPPAAGIIATAGAVLAGIGLVASFFKGATAKTDQEKMDAYRNGGAATFALATSFLGKFFKPLGTKKVAAQARVRKLDAAIKKQEKIVSETANAEAESQKLDALKAQKDTAKQAVENLKNKNDNFKDVAFELADKADDLGEAGARFQEAMWNKNDKLKSLGNWGRSSLYTGAVVGNAKQILGSEDKAFEDPRLRFYQQGMMGGYGMGGFGMNDQYGFNGYKSWNDLQNIYNSTNALSLA